MFFSICAKSERETTNFKSKEKRTEWIKNQNILTYWMRRRIEIESKLTKIEKLIKCCSWMASNLVLWIEKSFVYRDKTYIYVDNNRMRKKNNRKKWIKLNLKKTNKKFSFRDFEPLDSGFLWPERRKVSCSWCFHTCSSHKLHHKFKLVSKVLFVIFASSNVVTGPLFLLLYFGCSSMHLKISMLMVFCYFSLKTKSTHTLSVWVLSRANILKFYWSYSRVILFFVVGFKLSNHIKRIDCYFNSQWLWFMCIETSLFVQSLLFLPV